MAGALHLIQRLLKIESWARYYWPGNCISITRPQTGPGKRCSTPRLRCRPNIGLLWGTWLDGHIAARRSYSFHSSSSSRLTTSLWISSKADGKRPTPHTPKAPRHGPRPRLHLMDMRQIAAVLFQESTLRPGRIMPPGLPRPIFKPVASTRVLFYEDELCQAVAQNKLRWGFPLYFCLSYVYAFWSFIICRWGRIMSKEQVGYKCIKEASGFFV